jgi:hypothetical protein
MRPAGLYTESLNVGPDFCTVIGALALTSKGAVAKGGLVFDLDDINQSVLSPIFLQFLAYPVLRVHRHNFPIEHDASLSRQDAYFGDNHSFNETIYKTLKSSPIAGFTNVETAGEVRRARLADSVARNPKLFYTLQQAILAFGESALYLSVMGDPVRPLLYISAVVLSVLTLLARRSLELHRPPM